MMRGHLETPRKCRANRRINVYIRYLSDPSQWTLVDQGTSTTTGYWIGTGDDDGVNGWRITATRKNVGRPRHRHICDAGVFQN